MHAMQTTVATTLGSTPGALAFAEICFWTCCWLLIGRPLRVVVNIMSIRIYDVPTGSNISLTMLRNNKFWRKCTEGPCTIECVHLNGNLTILLCEGIAEHINIHWILPYCWPFHIPLWRQFLAWIIFEAFTFYLWSFISTSRLSES